MQATERDKALRGAIAAGLRARIHPGDLAVELIRASLDDAERRLRAITDEVLEREFAYQVRRSPMQKYRPTVPIEREQATREAVMAGLNAGADALELLLTIAREAGAFDEEEARARIRELWCRYGRGRLPRMPETAPEPT